MSANLKPHERAEITLIGWARDKVVNDIYERHVPAHITRARLWSVIADMGAEMMAISPKTATITVKVVFPAEMRNLRPHHFQD